MPEPTCSLCGEPMPLGETMFKFHGYSGPCPKPPLPRKFSYDPDCEGLARHFLSDGDLSQTQIDMDAPKLAQDIQDAVEAFFHLHHNRSDSY